MKTRGKRIDVGEVITVCVSVAALVLSILANRQSDRANELASEANRVALEASRKSAQPHLAFLIQYVPMPDSPAPGLYLINYGPGLAILETCKVSVDDKAVPEGWEAAVRMLELNDLGGFRVSTLGSTLPSGDEFRVLMVGFATDSVTEQHRDRLATAVSRLRIEIAYKSIYDDEYVCHLP